MRGEMVLLWEYRLHIERRTVVPMASPDFPLSWV